RAGLRAVAPVDGEPATAAEKAEVEAVADHDRRRDVAADRQMDPQTRALGGAVARPEAAFVELGPGLDVVRVADEEEEPSRERERCPGEEEGIEIEGEDLP